VSFVCRAQWTAQPGAEETVALALRHLSAATRTEPGNIFYQAYADPAKPEVFSIFEVYVDKGAFTAHTESEHFDEFALRGAFPHLADRQRAFFETLD
jgi:quinol monooxygenase YgiN